MHRPIVFLLAVIDAVIAVAVGLAVILAPLTLLWVFALPGASWGALWSSGATAWQFAMLVPLHITLPPEYVATVGIDPAAASFTLSLAPLAFAGFIAIFAARSGVRASRAEAWITGVVSGTLAVAILAFLIAVSAANVVADVELWQAVLCPTLLFGVPALAGAVVTEWREGGAGRIASWRNRVESGADDWAMAPGLIVRGAAVVLTGLIGAGAVLVAAALVMRGGEIVALYQASNVDALGATMITLAQASYLPTLVVWALSFIAGPGFAVGTATLISPAATSAGIVPGVPLLGALPESTSSWLLLLALIPVSFGVFAGWIARSRLVRTVHLRHADGSAYDPVAARLAMTAGIALVSALGGAAMAALASGSLGPGQLVDFGPQPGAVALAVGVEVAIGAGIVLLSPRRATDDHVDGWTEASDEVDDAGDSHTDRLGRSYTSTFPIEPAPFADAEPTEPAGSTEPSGSSEPAPSADAETIDLGPRRPDPGAPLD